MNLPDLSEVSARIFKVSRINSKIEHFLALAKRKLSSRDYNLVYFELEKIRSGLTNISNNPYTLERIEDRVEKFIKETRKKYKLD